MPILLGLAALGTSFFFLRDPVLWQAIHAHTPVRSGPAADLIESIIAGSSVGPCCNAFSFQVTTELHGLDHRDPPALVSWFAAGHLRRRRSASRTSWPGGWLSSASAPSPAGLRSIKKNDGSGRFGAGVALLGIPCHRCAASRACCCPGPHSPHPWSTPNRLKTDWLEPDAAGFTGARKKLPDIAHDEPPQPLHLHQQQQRAQLEDAGGMYRPPSPA